MFSEFLGCADRERREGLTSSLVYARCGSSSLESVTTAVPAAANFADLLSFLSPSSRLVIMPSVAANVAMAGAVAETGSVDTQDFNHCDLCS